MDALWSAINRDSFDIEGRMRASYRDKMFLGRYGRQSIDLWTDETVMERSRYIDALAQLLREENAQAKANPALPHQEHH